MYRKIGKRTIDVTASLLGLLLFFPLLLIIAIAIQIDSRRGVIFTQIRLGQNQKKFKIYKFRTMIPGAYEQGGIVTGFDDNRITRIGAFLRKTSLDESLQLINILKGDMSIIGPRPILPSEFEEYANMTHYYVRFDVRPGLFCTVDLDFRASASRELQFEMDADYCENIKFAVDFGLFFRIIKTVLTGKNVYKGISSEDSFLQETKSLSSDEYITK